MCFKLLLSALLLILTTAACAAEDDREVDAAYKRADNLLQPYLISSDVRPTDATTLQANSNILEAIQLLSTVVKARPRNWAAYWLIGKGYQALGDHEPAETALEQSYAINPTHRDIARELTIESICAGHVSKAIKIAEGSVKLNPSDAGVEANLGLAYLANGQLVQARRAAETALTLAPDDKVTLALLSEIVSVQGGRKPSRYCPYSEIDVSHYTIWCKVYIDEQGSPKTVEALRVEPRSESDAKIKKSVEQALLSWAFKPIIKDGKPVAGYVTIPVEWN